MNRITTFLVFLLLIVSELNAGKFDQLQFRRYTTEHGLPVGTVWKVYQDSCGFMWFGTENGLTYFDGLQFKSFTTSGSDGQTLTNSKIYDIVQGYDKKLYIATAEGITVFNKATGLFSPLQINDTTRNFLGQPIRSLYIESDSIVIAGSQTLGIIRLNIKTNEASILKLDIDNLYVRSIAKGSGEQYFVSTHGQGFYIIYPNGKTKHFFVTEDRAEAKNRVNQIFEYNDEKYWIATQHGLFVFDLASGLVSEINLAEYLGKTSTDRQVRKILRDSRGNIWIATYAGLLFLEGGEISKGHLFASSEADEFSISSNRLLDVMEDAGGSIWVSNYDVGVNVLHSIEVRFHYITKSTKPNSLPANIVTAFEKFDHQKILVGTIGGGVSLFDLNSQEFLNYNEKNKALGSRILSIYKQTNNVIWLGTWGEGLQKFNPATGTVVSYKKNVESGKSLVNNTVIRIVPHDEQHLWVATYGGLNRLNTVTNEFEQMESYLGIGNTAVFSIFRDTDNTLWLGTNGKGLLIFNPLTNVVERFMANEADSLSIASNTIYQITKDTRGNYYIATDKGICLFNRGSRKFSTIDESMGLSNNNVWGILEDTDNNLWVSGNKGICRIDTKKDIDSPEAFKTYGKKDGLRILEFSQGAYYYDKFNNLIFFGGTQGFYFFDPSHIKPRNFKPEIQLTSIKVMDMDHVSDTSVSFIQKLTLPYFKNFLAFEFVSLDFVDPSNNLFQYKVAGQSDKWSQPSTRNYVSFPDLKEGHYTLHVRGTNSEGYWSDKERIIHITITPPWWRTTIAYISYVLFLIISVFGFVRWRTVKLAHEKRVLEAIVAERTKELQQKNEDITSSIQYARRIQQAIIFPKITSFLREFPDSFVFFRPKDIVSGDFFWYGKKGNRRYFAAADCTGHGVPGAFMSIIGNNLLEKAIIEYDITDPHEILTHLDQDVKASLNQQGRKDDTFDGMDIALCAIDEGSDELLYAGAYRPLFLLRQGELIQTKATRGSIGGSQIKQEKKFVTERIKIQRGDTFYIFSDGITDQFGGPLNRKFSTSKLQSTLKDIQVQTMFEQEIFFEKLMDEWLEGYSQIDDIILTGIRFNNI
jgi:ligand-binding sensor domain-containing protein/serine phosphatase RsbU (regulator of sigma subunit)